MKEDNTGDKREDRECTGRSVRLLRRSESGSMECGQAKVCRTVECLRFSELTTKAGFLPFGWCERRRSVDEKKDEKRVRSSLLRTKRRK